MAEQHELYRRACYRDIVFDRDVCSGLYFMCGRVRAARRTQAAPRPRHHAWASILRREFAWRGPSACALDLRR
jgi:hypothetical protein